MKPTHNFYEASYLEASSFLPEMSKVLNTCDHTTRIMISIYLIKENRFLYANKVFKNSIGVNPKRLITEGWNFWFSLIVPCEVAEVRNSISNFFAAPLARDTITLQYHLTNFQEDKLYIKHEILIYKLKRKMVALNYFFDITEKEEVERCVKVNGGCRGKDFFRKQCNQISSREVEVLKLIADGFSSKQIAEKLFISNHTAITHRKHLIKKFQAKNTAQLIKKATLILEL